MTELVIAIVGGVTLFAFAVQLGLPERRGKLLDCLNVSLLLGLMSVGVLAYLVTPSLVTEVSLVPYFSPHAYNLVFWPAFGLVLRKVFPEAYVIPALVFVYCLDELLWNGLAVAFFWGQWDVLAYLSLTSWHVFITVLVSAGAVCYMVVRPKMNLNVMWGILAGFAFLWAWVAGFPVLAATNIGSLSFEQTAYRLCWEVMWQAVILAWAYATLKPRVEQAMPNLPRPSVG